MTRLLVSAGPTHEPIDRVRYLANRSSGKLGYAIAGAGVARGFDVELVSGPTQLAFPAGVRGCHVETALEMQAALEERFDVCDVLVMAAAVADYRPAERVEGKIKKQAGETHRVLELVINPDILATLALRRRPGQVLVGFALEAVPDLEQAERKRRAKGVDWLVLNEPKTLSADRSDFTLLSESGPLARFEAIPKAEFAMELLGRVAT